MLYLIPWRQYHLQESRNHITTKIVYSSSIWNNSLANLTIMDLLARFVGIMMLFVIYIAVGIEGVAYGATCTGTGAGECDEANNICVAGTSKCACATTSFRKGGKECAKKIALTEACTATPTDQCADSNAECNATGLTCECKSAYYVNKDSACDPQIALTKACTTGQPPDQCVDDNAVCDATASKCQCKSAYFVSKTSGTCKQMIAALDAACDALDSTSHQCSVVNSECRKDGTDRCLCKATHYVNGATCAIRKKPDEESCAADECVTNATCNTKSNPTKCQCDTGFTATPTIKPTMCSGVPKVTTLSNVFVVLILLSMKFLLQ